MNTFNLTISSPEGTIFQGEVSGITLRGADGDLAILAGHIPFITSVKPGACKVIMTDDTEKIGYVDGGLLTVSSDAVNLLAGSFEWQDNE